MGRVSVCVIGVAIAVLWAGAARAERASDALAAGAGATFKPQPRPAPPGPVMFAPTSAATAKRLSIDQREERRFLKDAAAASRFESEASRLALSRSSDADVRSFAAMLLRHHAPTGTVLQHMLHGRGMAPPMLANDQRKTLNLLARLHGAKFDREYIGQVGLKHQLEDVRAYEQAGLATHDPMLRQWIDGILPTLRDHLSMAERINAAADARLLKARTVRATRSTVNAASSR